MSFFRSHKWKSVFLSGILVFAVILSLPSKANAQFFGGIVYDPTVNASIGISKGVDVAKWAADGLAWYAAKIVVQKLTAQTVNWINSGFKGNPAYVTNPGQFFLGVADQTASAYLSDKSNAINALCSPFRAQVRLALVKNYLSSNQNYSCTLGTLLNNYNSFTRDFSQGGWDSWFTMTQTNQNNPYGSYVDTKNQLALEIGTQQNKYQQQLNWGQGFLSFETCRSGTTYTKEDGSTDCDPANKQVSTPGSVINSQLEKSLGSGVDALNAADSVNEIVGALVTELFSKVVGGIGNGLRGASGGNPNFTAPPAFNPGNVFPSPTPGSPTPTPPPPGTPTGPLPTPVSSLDISQVNILNSPNVSTWAETAQITSVNLSPVSVQFTKKDGQDAWPDHCCYSGFTGPLQYTIWLIENIDGQWYGSGGIEFWHDRADTGDSIYQARQDWYYATDRWGPMATHVLQSGEQIGIMVTAGDARNNNGTILNERSNIYLITLP
jgi:hypothetical protein